MQQFATFYVTFCWQLVLIMRVFERQINKAVLSKLVFQDMHFIVLCFGLKHTTEITKKLSQYGIFKRHKLAFQQAFVSSHWAVGGGSQLASFKPDLLTAASNMPSWLILIIQYNLSEHTLQVKCTLKQHTGREYASTIDHNPGLHQKKDKA